MQGQTLESLQEKTKIDDFNKLSAEDAGRFLKSVNDEVVTTDDIVKVIDSSSNFLGQICSITTEVRALLSEKTTAKTHLIEALFKGLETQCYALESIAAQCDTANDKIEIAKMIERISRDYFATIRELNKADFDWLLVGAGLLLAFLLGMGVVSSRNAPRAT